MFACIPSVSSFNLSPSCSKAPEEGDTDPCVCPVGVKVQGPVTNSSWVWNSDYAQWQAKINNKNDAPIKIAGDGVAGTTYFWDFMQDDQGNNYVRQELIYWGVPAEGAVDDARSLAMKNAPGGPNGTKIMDRFGVHLKNVIYSCQMVWSDSSGIWWMVLSATGETRGSHPIPPSCRAGTDCPVPPSCYLREADCRWDTEAEDWNCRTEAGVDADPCVWDPTGGTPSADLDLLQANNNLYDSCRYTMTASTMTFPASSLVTDPTANLTVVIGNPARTRNGAELKPADPAVGGGLRDTLLLCNDILYLNGKLPSCGQVTPPPPAPSLGKLDGSNVPSRHRRQLPSSSSYTQWPNCPDTTVSYWTSQMCHNGQSYFFNCLNARLIEDYASRALSWTFLSIIVTGGIMFATGWLFFFCQIRDPVEEESDGELVLIPPSVRIQELRKVGKLMEKNRPMICSKCASTLHDKDDIKIKTCPHCEAPRKDFMIFSKYENDWVPMSEDFLPGME